MFTYPLKYIESIDLLHKFIAKMDAGVDFENPFLVQIYADQEAGLCTIKVQHPEINIMEIINTGPDSILEISYHDPELEFIRKLQK